MLHPVPRAASAVAAVTVILATAATSTGLAQSRVWTMPAGYLSTEGDGGSRNLGSFGTAANGRSMFFGALRTQTFTLKELAFRPNFDNYAIHPATGRTWTNISLRMAEGDPWVGNSSFSQKLLTTQTLVLSSSMSWPSLGALPATRPAPFSIRFPFRTPWTYTGRFELCADFLFQGGTLANNGPWGIGLTYPLDLAQNTGLQQVDAPGVQIGANGCRNTGSPAAATLWTSQALWHPWVSTQFGVRIAADAVGNANALLAVGLAGSTSGINLPGVGCQRLYVDLTQPTVYLLLGTSNSGALLTALVNHQPSYFGAEFWAQVAWPDSSTGQLKLTPASRQGLYAPLSAGGHLEMFGTGNLGAIDRRGGPICLYRE